MGKESGIVGMSSRHFTREGRFKAEKISESSMTFIYDDIISNCQVQSALKVISLPQFKQTFGPYKLLVFKRSLGVLPNVPASSRIRAKSWRNSPKITFKKWLNRLVLNLKLSSSTPCQTKKNSVKIIYKKKKILLLNQT